MYRNKYRMAGILLSICIMVTGHGNVALAAETNNIVIVESNEIANEESDVIPEGEDNNASIESEDNNASTEPEENDSSTEIDDSVLEPEDSIEQEETVPEIPAQDENDGTLNSEENPVPDQEETEDVIEEINVPEIVYQVHLQRQGWQEWVNADEIAGMADEGLRIEAVKIKVNNSEYEGSVEYRVHIQSIGWQEWKKDGELAGTEGESLRIEAIQIRLTGELSEKVDVYYCTYVQDIGWLGFTKDGESSGTERMSRRIETLKITLNKRTEPIETSERSFIKGLENSDLQYSGHVQGVGNTLAVSNGEVIGKIGESKRLEALKITLDTSDTEKLQGNIEYQAHIQGIGWQEWKIDGEWAGTSGQQKRMEAVKIQLSGEVSDYYDIYYRVHIQNYGWLGWAKNGEAAGSEGISRRIEAIQIQFIQKGYSSPGKHAVYYIPEAKALDLEIIYQNPEFPNGCEAIALNNVMKYYGYNISKNDICYTYLPRGSLHSTDPYVAYMGDPGSKNGGYGCWAPVIVKTAKNYFSEKGITGKKAKNITGSSTEQLFKYIVAGTPVVIWGTLNMGSTNWFKAGYANGEAVYWPSNAHCMVLTGYDYERSVIKVNDPIRGKVEYSIKAFEKAFFVMGKNAVVIE